MTHEPIELCQPWYPGGAQGNEFDFKIGEEYLLAVEISAGDWIIYHCVFNGDGRFGRADDGGEFDWDWNDVEWVAKLADFHFPPIGD